MSTVDFLGALGAGSDIDSKSLVESLVAAERAPEGGRTQCEGRQGRAEDLRLRTGPVIAQLTVDRLFCSERRR